jgi:recombination protein RecT
MAGNNTSITKAQQAQKSSAITSFKGLKTTQIKDTLEKYLPQFQNSLPKHLNPERFIQIATDIISRQPEIKDCSFPSVIGSLMQASILGFKPTPALGECYFVPFWNKKTQSKELQFQIGYKGLIKLAMQSGQIQMIYAQVVVKDDEFEYQLGTDPKIIHKPNAEAVRFSAKPEEITHAYSVVKFKDGAVIFEVINFKDIESYRMRSPAQKGSASGPWGTDYAAMAKKTAIKRIAPYLPMSEDSAQMLSDGQVITPDNLRDDGKGFDIEEAVYEEAVYEEIDGEEVNTETGEIRDKSDMEKFMSEATI